MLMPLPAPPTFPALALRPAAVGARVALAQAADVLGGGLATDFVALHAEECMGAGGPPHRALAALRQHHPLALHDIGLAPGSDQPLDRDHLARLRALVDRYEPSLFTTPLAWSTHDGIYFGEPLPIPYNDETLARVCGHLDHAQRAIGIPILLENPPSYLQLASSRLDAGEFLRAVVARTGCGLMLDVTSAYLSARNQDIEAMDAIDCFPIEHVRAMRLGGCSESADDIGAPLLTSDGSGGVPEPVWTIYGRVLARTGPLPTVVECTAPDAAARASGLARAKNVLRFETRRRARQLHA